MIAFWKGTYWLFITARTTPSAVSRLEGTRPFQMEFKYLFYPVHQPNPSTPSDICYVKGTLGWIDEACLNLSSSEETLHRVDSARVGSNIYVLYKPTGDFTLHYLVFNTSRQVTSIVDTNILHYPGDNGRMCAGNQGLFVSYVALRTGPKWRFLDISGGYQQGSLPGVSCSDQAPTLFYDETDDVLWTAWTDCSGVVWTSQATWSCLSSGSPSCWSTARRMPGPYHSAAFDLVATSSPAIEELNNDLYLSQTVDGPFGSPTVWTDSCIDYRTSHCDDETDKRLPSGTGDWANTVPRYTISEDAAELLEYDGRLWLYSIDPATNLIYQVSKRSD